MKIFEAKPDVNNVQWIIPNAPEKELLSVLTFDCESKSAQLKDIDWYIFNPKRKKCNFFSGVNGALIFDQDVYDGDLFTLFEMAGEIIPLKMEDGGYLYALNVMECLNCLDKKKTRFDYYDNGTQGRILDFSFYSNRISESSIFKIPETSTTQILTYADIHAEDDELYYLYKRLRHTGLIFKELWSE